MSPFATHITEVVNSLMLDRDRTKTAKALIRERSMETRHMAEQIRAKASGVPVLADLASQLEERVQTLGAIAEQWPRQLQKKDTV